MSINLNTTINKMASGTTSTIYDNTGYITTSSGTGTYYTTPKINEVFKNMSKTFNLELEQGEIDFLDQLYDSNDEQNRTLACEMFKHMLAKQTK
jgi:hypothetical protein